MVGDGATDLAARAGGAYIVRDGGITHLSEESSLLTQGGHA